MRTKTTAIILTAFILISTQAMAYSEKDAINAIIGEAENQGYKGMLAIGCAIRNRGSLKGVYGHRSKRVKNCLYSAKTFVDATRAWNESSKKDITNGATGWGNAKDIEQFKREGWWHKCIVTVIIKDHIFYKER